MYHGFIFIHRKMLDWEWYDDINTKVLFLHILLKANFTDKKWKGKTIKRGQFITSIYNLSNETGLSVRQVRTALKHLESTHEITRETTHHWTTINVLNYDNYQPDPDKSDTPKDTPKDKRPTHERHTTDTRATTTNNDNNDYTDNNDKKKEKDTPSEKSDSIPYKEIVGYLNEQAERQFRHSTDKTKKLIKARWNKGWKLEDFKYVIDRKVEEWKDDPKMDKYLRPETLFGTNFESYLNERPISKHKTDKEKNNEKNYTDEELGIIEV